MIELEWLSVCCGAPPKFPIDEEDDTNWDIIGICNKCKENTSFELWGDEDKYE